METINYKFWDFNFNYVLVEKKEYFKNMYVYKEQRCLNNFINRSISNEIFLPPNSASTTAINSILTSIVVTAKIQYADISY